jgi:hypothetical protein
MSKKDIIKEEFHLLVVIFGGLAVIIASVMFLYVMMGV